MSGAWEPGRKSAALTLPGCLPMMPATILAVPALVAMPVMMVTVLPVVPGMAVVVAVVVAVVAGMTIMTVVVVSAWRVVTRSMRAVIPAVTMPLHMDNGQWRKQRGGVKLDLHVRRARL